MINKMNICVAFSLLLLSCGRPVKVPRSGSPNSEGRPNPQGGDTFERKEEAVETKVKGTTGSVTDKLSISAAPKIQLPVDFVVIPDANFLNDAVNGPIVTNADGLPENVREMTALLQSSGVPSYQGWVFGLGPGSSKPLNFQATPNVQAGGTAAARQGVYAWGLEIDNRTLLNKAIGLVTQTDNDTLTVRFRQQSIKAFIFLSRYALQTNSPAANDAQILEFVDLMERDSKIGNNRSMVFGFTITSQFSCPVAPEQPQPPINTAFATFASTWGGAAYNYCSPVNYRGAMMDIGQKIAKRATSSREFKLTKKPTKTDSIEVRCLGGLPLKKTYYFYDAERNSVIFPDISVLGPKSCESDTLEVGYQ